MNDKLQQLQSDAAQKGTREGGDILKAVNVSKRYIEGGSEIFALHGLNIAIREGETIAVTGESGAGKSTLLHVLGLLDTPTDGELFYRGRNLYEFEASVLAEIRNTRFGFVFQFFHLLPDLNALENVMLPCMVQTNYFDWNRKQAKERAAQALERVGLAGRMRHRSSQLSGGEKQRVAIARALVQQPEVVFCDEPTGNLDSKTSSEIHDLLFELNETSGQTFVIVTHDMALASRTHRIARMQDGSICEIIERS